MQASFLDKSMRQFKLLSTLVLASLPPKLKRDVLKWFREDRTPQPADIRRAISARVGLELPDHSAEMHLYVMNELYEIKSKWVHPAFSPIRETLRTYPLESTAAITGFDYGPCSYPRKLHELTLFYRSSIWTGYTRVRIVLSTPDSA